MLKWTKQQQETLPSFPLHTNTLKQQNLNTNKLSNKVENLKKFKKLKIDNRYSSGNLSDSNADTSLNRMPTMTQTLERRLHRRSLDNQLQGGSQADKENFGVHFMRRSPFGNTSTTALQDLSNGRSPQPTTPTFATAATDPLRRRRTLGASRLNTPTSPTAQSHFSGRFSDDFADADDKTPLSRMRFVRKRENSFDSSSSSRMGDTTLDRMLDAIIESARKETTTTTVKTTTTHRESSSSSPSSTPSSSLYGDDCEPSIHEMEVCTPTHLKRQRVVRRKNTRANELRAQRASVPAATATTTATITTPPPPMIGLTLPNGIPSPDTPLFKPSDSLARSGQREQQHCSTPTALVVTETQSIKRCLSFGDDDDVDEESVVDDADYSAAKRSSVASSNASSSSSSGEHYGYYSGRSSHSSESSIRAASVRGSLDLAIFVAQEKLNVHVIRCRDLQRSNGSTALNAYVKVALIRKPTATAKAPATEHGFQRTAVHRHSSRPYFDHRFKFDLTPEQTAEPVSEMAAVAQNDEEEDRLQLAVWHRDRHLKRSEFLGCIAFPLQALRQQPINGAYKLQSQACLNKPQTAVPTLHTQQQHHHHPLQQPQALNTFTQHTPQLQPTLTNADKTKSDVDNDADAEMKGIGAVDDDVISIDSMAQAAAGPPPQMVLSKKALHQRDADENLFLRFLELDPPADAIVPNTTGAASSTTTTVSGANNNANASIVASAAAAVAAAAGGAGGSQSSSGAGRRLSAGGIKALGRTPFTMTKKLTRTAERGFGFSIVWTHPPRVEKIEAGLSAAQCGIAPGDYVIFVDKHNVVTMPEADVLNLIRSQGAALTLEIFRRSGSGGGGGGASGTCRSSATTAVMNGKHAATATATASSRVDSDELLPAAMAPTMYTAATAPSATTITTTAGIVTSFAAPPAPPARRANAVAIAAASNVALPSMSAVSTTQVRPSTACSGTSSSIEAAKRRLNLPQVTFSKESILPITDNRRRFLLQLISREQNFISALHFGMQRFVQPLQERKDLISPNDHRVLFQNIDELLRIAEDILEQLCNDDQEPQMTFASRVYLSKTTAICAAYKKYCNGIKRADCVLVNKSRQSGSEFVAFITEPQVPRKRPDLTMFIHRPLQHFREILKLMQLLASNCHVDTEEHKNFTSVINELQAAYREITMSSGLMEPLGEGRPLLTLQDLESRMVFTKCKPFTLAVQGRQWIFGGDLSRVEGRSVKPYWTLLFSDIIVFAKVSRDRVLFITEEPVPIANIVDSCFHMRKKTTEFRLTVDPNGRLAESPTGYCAPDLTRTPKKTARRKSLVLRAPSLELKAVWQNLLQRQIFLVNAALGSTPLSSPLDSPDVLNTLVPLSDIGMAGASIGSIKHSSLDSINLSRQHQQQQLQQPQQQHHHQQQQNQQQQQQQQNNTNHLLTTNPSDQIEMLIDEKCRILNKTGTPKSSALHLANWMKGQLDKQQEQARLAAARSRENISHEDEHLLYPESDNDERITYWTRQQLEKRTKELNLAKENGCLAAKPNFGGKRLSGVEELSMSDVYSEGVSQISQSRSTTSDSQITVRSSPIVLDKLAVCRHCHKNCQQSQQQQQQEQQQYARPSSTSPISQNSAAAAAHAAAADPLVCNSSLKVQHSQSSPNRCCRINGKTSAAAAGRRSSSRADSTTSMSSSTVTGDQPTSEHSSKLVANCRSHSSRSRRDEETTGDTESDVAQLITDDLSHSEATDDTGNAIPSSSSGIEEAHLYGGTSISNIGLTTSLSKLRILDDKNEALELDGPPPPAMAILMNGHCGSSERSFTHEKQRSKPEPPPRKLKIQPQTVETPKQAQADQKVKTTVTITETAKIVRNTQEQDLTTVTAVTAIKQQQSGTMTMTTTTATSTTPKKSPKSPRTPKSPADTRVRPSQFTPCHCECTPADFENTTLSPDELQQQTCKLIESPKQSPKMPRQQNGNSRSIAASMPEDPHRHCKCVCGTAVGSKLQDDEDDDLSLMLIGLAQFTPAAKLFNMKPTPAPPLSTPTNATMSHSDGFVPTIAVVPPTPDAILTKTSTNLWDNTCYNITTTSISTSNTTATTATNSTGTKLQYINNVPHQAVIENILDDSCDESPLDEEPPYRPMNSANLRRFGTMSSLEKMPSEDRLDDGDLDELDDDDDDQAIEKDLNDEHIDDDDDDDDDVDDNARADNVDNDIHVVTKAVFDDDDDDDDEAGTSAASAGGGGAWTSRAGSYVAGKMSFFEESRAFIDKYLGRWNQEQQASLGGMQAAAANSDGDEQMDECTSGATSGEEVWGTPTSGGDNDDMHLVNSENTHSSPTKSSTSLNDDDDDTELMMDELLMAPPMTASTIRGLLPRRRLEPLFEEETESDEEKTQQESEELKKGETTTNGHDLEDSAGSSSDEDLEENKQESNDEEEDEELTSTEERLYPNLQTSTLGPRPLRNPGTILLPAAVLKASSCEYLLEQRSAVALQTISSCSSNLHAATASFNSTNTAGNAPSMTTTTIVEQQLAATHQKTTTTMMMSTTTMMRETMTMKSPTPPLAPPLPMISTISANQAPSSTSTTISNANVTTSKGSDCSPTTTSASTTTARRPAAKFIPPPPPPRLLLLTQTNLKTGGNNTDATKAPQRQRKYGVFADSGFSVDAGGGDKDVSGIHKTDMRAQKSTITTTTITIPATSATMTTTTLPLMSSSTVPISAAMIEDNKPQPPPRAAYNIRNSVENIAPVGEVKRPIISSTIIETSLLGRRQVVADKNPISTSSTTVSTTKASKATQQRKLQSDNMGDAKTTTNEDATKMRQATTQREADECSSASASAPAPPAGSGLSPRLEMRLALNHDILGDEDLICYDPGPDLTTILGHDLSTFQRLTGRDLLSRSAMNRVQPKEAVISFSQQRNSKMDTPTVNRRPRPCGSASLTSIATSSSSGGGLVGSARVAGAPQLLQPNRNTWSSSASVDRIGDVSARSVASNKNSNCSSDANNMGDLEILARREKIYCMSQLRSGLLAKTTKKTTTKKLTTRSKDSSINPQLMRTTSITSMGAEIEGGAGSSDAGSAGAAKNRVRKIGRDETALMEASASSSPSSAKGNRLIDFIKRRNSEIPISPDCSQSSLNESNASSTPVHRQQQQMPMSPRKDNDKPSLNRRLWKQITKRRRANSVSEIVAS